MKITNSFNPNYFLLCSALERRCRELEELEEWAFAYEGLPDYANALEELKKKGIPRLKAEIELIQKLISCFD